MTLNDRINEDLKTALKAKNSLTVSALRMLIAAIKNAEITKRPDTLSDADITAVVKKQHKQRLESAQAFADAGRAESCEKEKAEAGIISKYLPKQLSDNELNSIIDEIIDKNRPVSSKDFGNLMKKIMERTDGGADGKRVSQALRTKLN